MAKPSPDRIARALLDEHGATFAREAGIRLKDAPKPLFQLLVLALLSSARISSRIALDAARGLFKAGLSTPEKMADAKWDERVRILNEAGYTRYQERTSTMLYETASRVLDEYGGDLRRLRSEAGCEPKKERTLLKRFKGIGETGADIFFREAQAVWAEHFPFVDDRAKSAAKAVGLPTSKKRLQELAGDGELPTLLDAALMEELEGDPKELRARARRA